MNSSTYSSNMKVAKIYIFALILIKYKGGLKKMVIIYNTIINSNNSFFFQTKTIENDSDDN